MFDDIGGRSTGLVVPDGASACESSVSARENRGFPVKASGGACYESKQKWKCHCVSRAGRGGQTLFALFAMSTKDALCV